MSIARLHTLAPAPSAGRIEPRQWQAVEDALQLELPDDYKDVVEAYGSGKFANFLTIFTPFTTNGYLNLFGQRDLALDAYRTLRASHPDAAPFPAHPEPGGLLPWGQTDNGDMVYWLTEGPSQSWPVIVIESRHAFTQRYDLSTTEFLARLLEGRLSPEIFPTSSEQRGAARFATVE
jgi:hypothetical protein